MWHGSQSLMHGLEPRAYAKGDETTSPSCVRTYLDLRPRKLARYRISYDHKHCPAQGVGPEGCRGICRMNESPSLGQVASLTHSWEQRW